MKSEKYGRKSVAERIKAKIKPFFSGQYKTGNIRQQSKPI